MNQELKVHGELGNKTIGWQMVGRQDVWAKDVWMTPWHSWDDWATTKTHVLHRLPLECTLHNCYITSGSAAIIWHSHTKLIDLAEHGRSALKGLGTNGVELPKWRAVCTIIIFPVRTHGMKRTQKWYSPCAPSWRHSLNVIGWPHFQSRSISLVDVIVLHYPPKPLICIRGPA